MSRVVAWVLLLLALASVGCASDAGDVQGRAGADLPDGVGSGFAGLMEREPPAFRDAAAERGLVTTEAGVVVDVQTEGLKAVDRAALDLPGVQVRSFHPEYERVSAVADSPSAVRAIARLPFVRMVVPARGATTNTDEQGARE